MKLMKAMLSFGALALLGGCAVYPAGYYGPPRAAYYQPAPVYYGPAVGVGVYGGWHEGWHDGRR